MAEGETVVVGDAQLLGRAIDDPEAYIPSDRRRALAAGVGLPDRVEGAALFADISGFTPLTEALARELSGLQYDSTSQRYTYTWKTSKTFAGRCYELRLGLVDGSDRTATFRFK